MNPLIRICPPSKYDPAPYKTICYVEGEHGIDGYIQVSLDDQTPCWVPIGEFLWAVFGKDLAQDDNEDFLDRCMAKYKGE